jgi:hypothetical protein
MDDKYVIINKLANQKMKLTYDLNEAQAKK